MATNIEELYKEIMELPDESKAILAEQIVEYLETHVDPGLERLHLDAVKRRRDEMRSGKVKAVDGNDAATMARKIISQ